ncbi:MAG TPA: CHAT domain-containing protein [bacterium]|nr:CHAT domain-containing protein [bacterium]
MPPRSLRHQIESILEISLAESVPEIVSHITDPGPGSRRDFDCHYAFFEIAEHLISNASDSLSADELWKILDVTVTVCSRTAPDDPSPFIATIRACMDRFRRQSAMPDPGGSGRAAERREILSAAADIMDRWGDPTAARGLIRRQADLMVQAGRFADAFDILDGTICWLRRLEVENLLFQAECLENSILQDGPDPWRVRKIAFVERLCVEAADRFGVIPESFRARLYHSAALIHRACEETSTALDLLERSARLAGIETDLDRSPGNTAADPDTRLMIISSWLQTVCAAGYLARADELFFLGRQLLMNHSGSISSRHRFTFRQNAAGYLYRIGNIREAERIYHRIDAEDGGGRAGGVSGYAAVLSSKALVFRKKGYIRRSERYHRKALDILQDTRKNSVSSARAMVHLATALMELDRAEEARSLLEQAMVLFDRKHLREDGARSRGILARCHRVLGNDHAALEAYDSALDRLSGNTLEDHELSVSLNYGRAGILARLNQPEQALETLHRAEKMFQRHKRRFRSLKSRMSYSKTHRSAIIDTLTLPGRPIESRWNTALQILENDRADLFADSLSYYIKALDDPRVNQLYLSFLDLQSRYLGESSRAAGSTHANGSTRVADHTSPAGQPARDHLESLHQEIDAAFKILFQNKTDAADFLTGHTISIDRLLAAGSPDCANHRYAAYILDTHQLHIFTAVPGDETREPVLGHILTGEALDDAPGSLPLEFDLSDRINQLRVVFEDTRRRIESRLDLLMRIDKTLRPVETENFLNQWQQLRRLFRRLNRRKHSLKLLVETSVYLINTSFLLIRICGLHPEFKKDIRHIHPSDRIAFETLFDLLIRPVETFYPPDARVILFVSEILSRVSFESLINPGKPLPEGYFVFPKRCFNYFRSPGLFSRVFQTAGKPSESRIPDHHPTLTLFTPLEPDVTETVDAYRFQHLAEQASDSDRRAVFRWLAAREATRQAFETEAPQSDQLLVETHCTFDRIQPFLSRLLFAGGEPVTAMDIFARYTFEITALMILVACESDQIYDIDIENVGVSVAEAMLCKGIDRIVAPKWMIERRSARELIRRFVGFIGAGENPMEALAEAHRVQAAMRGLHPYFWAGVSFSGLPGGCRT